MLIVWCSLLWPLVQLVALHPAPDRRCGAAQVPRPLGVVELVLPSLLVSGHRSMRELHANRASVDRRTTSHGAGDQDPAGDRQRSGDEGGAPREPQSIHWREVGTRQGHVLQTHRASLSLACRNFVLV